MRSALAVGLALALAAAPARAQTPLSRSELVTRLSSALDSLARRDEFSGVVVVARGDTPVFQHAYGDADRATHTPNRIDTGFNVGSIDKVFTATAIRQLAGQGKLDLDSTLAKYWPDYPDPDVARRVTIRQILQMRSGIGGDIFAAPPGGTRHDIRRLRDFVPLFASRPLEFEPGTQERYSNAGFIVLGLLVERLSSESYFDYVRRHVFEPAGMTSSGWWPADSLPPNTAIGYTPADSSGRRVADAPLHANTALLPGRGSSAGGGYATARDLLRFLAALRAGRIPGGPPPGLGVAGGAPGLNAVLEGALPGGYDLVVLANLDPPAAERVARLVRGWLGARE